MQTCTHFATYASWLSRELERTDPDLAGSQKPASMSKQQWSRFQSERKSDSSQSTSSNGTSGDEPRMEKMNDNITKIEYNFGRHLQILLDSLNHYAATETVVLLGLCARLSTANSGTQFSGLRTDEGAQA